MKTFKTTQSNAVYYIDESTFDNVTGHQKPYVKTTNGEESYFALCPICENPIQLCSLFKTEKGSMKPFGRHCFSNGTGMGEYNKAEIENCPFYDGSKHEGDYRIKNSDKTNKLYQMFLEHPDACYRAFTEQTGILVTNALLKDSVTSWFANQKWRYYANNMCTLPFILFYPKQFKFYGAVIRIDSVMYKCLNSIKNKYHIEFVNKYDNGYVQVKTDSTNVRLCLKFAIQEYVCSKAGEQTFELRIYDATTAKIIKKEKIVVDETLLTKIIESGYKKQNVLDYVLSQIKKERKKP